VSGDNVRKRVETFVANNPGASVIDVLAGLGIDPEQRGLVADVLGVDEGGSTGAGESHARAWPHKSNAENRGQYEDPVVGSDGWSHTDFAAPESDVWPATLVEHRCWMVRQRDDKQPFAPWGSRAHPDADPEKDARFSWSIADNWTDKATADEWVEMDPRLEGYAVILDSETDAYTENPDPVALVDGDDVRDPKTGEVHPAYIELLERLGLTYADVSRSASGIHALYEGQLPADVKRAAFPIDTEPWGANDEAPSVEIYDGKRVCVVTGEHVPGTPDDVRPWDESALAAILNEHVPDADRHRPASHDTDTEDPLDDYEPTVTGAHESTDEIRDVFYAVENLRPADLPLRTTKVGEEGGTDGWEKWDPSSYRTSSGGDSLHRPPRENVFYDQKTGHTFGLLALFAAEQGILSKPWHDLSGSAWWDAVDAAREVGAPIPEFDGSTNSEDGEREQHAAETCAPPAYEPEPFDREQRWRELEGERYEAWLDRERAHIWGDGAGTGKTTNAALAAANRDRPHVVLFDKHAKAREFLTSDVTPGGYFHLKGGEQPLHDCCMDATVDADEGKKPECPVHGHPASWPRMNPIYESAKDNPLRERYEVLVSVVGPRRALFLLDEDGELTEENPWLAQFDALATEERVVGVHEYQTLKTVLEGESVGERDPILDETPRLLASERRVSVEDLVRVENRLNDLAGTVGGIGADGALANDYRELAAFAGRVRDAIVADEAGALQAVEPPAFDGGEYFEVKDPISGQGVKQNNVAEAAAQVKLAYNEAGIRRVQDDEWNGEPFCIDQLLAAAAKAGLPDEGLRQAIALPPVLESCPWCAADLGYDNGARCCTECGWHERENSVTTKDGEAGRAMAWLDDDPDELDRDEDHSLAFKALPDAADLPDPLVLDATATPEKVAGLYGQDRDAVDIEGDRPVDLDGQLRVTQVVGGRYGESNQFHAGGQYHAQTIKDTEALQDRIQSTIDTAGDLHDRPLFGIRKDLVSLFDFPANGEVLHYGGARGLDFEECDAVVCIGAPHPNVDDLRRDAELLAMDHDELRVGGGEYSTRRNAPNPPVYRKLLYEDENGEGLAVPTKAYSGLVGTLFYEGREKEIEQFVHRIRPVLADDLKHAYLLTDVPTDLPVDDVVGLEELADPIQAMLPVSEGAVRLLGHVLDAENGDGPDGFRPGELVEQRGDGTVANKVAGFDRLARLCGEDVTTRTVRNWVDELEGLGLLTPEAYEQRRGVSYTADIATSKQALQVLSRNGGFEVATKRRLASLAAELDSGLAWLSQAVDLVTLTGDRCAWLPGLNGGDRPPDAPV